MGPQAGGRGREILDSKLIGGLRDSVGELAGEDDRAVVAVIIDVVFPKAGIEAFDDVVEVFVDEYRGGAEDDEVEVEDSEGVVEVRFG